MTSRLAVRLGDFPGARREADDALELALTCAEPGLVALAQVAVGRSRAATGDNELALAALEAAWALLEHSTAPDDVPVRLACMGHLGAVLTALGLVEEGIRWRQRALDDAREAPWPAMEGTLLVALAGSWIDLGEQRMRRGEEAAAREAWEQGVRVNQGMLEELGALPAVSPRPHTYALLGLAESLERLGRDSQALAAFLAVRGSEYLLRAETRFSLSCQVARILVRRGELEAAREEVEHAVDAAEGLGVRMPLMRLYELGSQIAELSGDAAEALERYRLFHALHTELIEEARHRSHLVATRLDTENTLVEIQAERARNRALARANRSLSDRAGELEHVALVDPLTGLGNRRRLDTSLAAAHRQALARHQPLSVAMLDLDRFKQINDGFSHAVGDEVLRRVAELLGAHSRDGDLVARYGGEEFVVAFVGADAAAAALACERLRADVEGQDWDRVARGLRVTLSGGVCDVACFSDLATGLLRADSLLYAAKGDGRNRITTDSG